MFIIFSNFFAFSYGLTLKMTIFAENGEIMPLKIKDVAKSQGMTMAQIAEKLGINPITLSQSLNGNPTLSRLTEVANVLGVDVSELFVQPKGKQDIHGCIFVDGDPVVVNGKEELLKFAKALEERL